MAAEAMAKRRLVKFGITEKLWLSMVALTVVVMLPVGIALDRGVNAFYIRRHTEELLDIAGRFAQFVARAPGPEAGGAVRAIAEITGTPLLVIDDNGVVVASSAELASEIGQRLQNPRILQALSGNPSVFLASDQTLPGTLFVTTVPIEVRGEVTGAVVVFRAAGDVQEAMITVRRLIAAAAVSLLLLSTGLTWILSRRLTRPLLKMKDVTRALATGDYSTSVKVSGGDELEELAHAINDLASSLHQLETGRRAFFANVSHELRTPLSYLQGYADALADGLAKSPEEVKDVGKILSEESRRLGRLVNDLFELARAEEGSLSLQLEEIDVSSVVSAAVSRILHGAKEKEIEITQEVVHDLRAFADGDRVEQVLLNLLDNAIRHTPEGGRVHLEGQTDDDRVVISVEDSGPGLGVDGDGQYDLVFERFYRREKSRNRHSGGAGLGLAIVKSLVEAMGGRVWATKSERLGGAIFCIALPLVDDDVSRER